jgi:hypothetical protein
MPAALNRYMTVASSMLVVEGASKELNPGLGRSAHPETGSFRSGWQTLLASMGTETHEKVGTETGALSKERSVAERTAENSASGAGSSPVNTTTAKQTVSKDSAGQRIGASAEGKSKTKSSVEAAPDSSTGYVVPLPEAVATATAAPVVAEPATGAARDFSLQSVHPALAFMQDQNSIATSESIRSVSGAAVTRGSVTALTGKARESERESRAGYEYVVGKAASLSAEIGEGQHLPKDESSLTGKQSAGAADDSTKPTGPNGGLETASHAEDSPVSGQATSAVAVHPQNNLLSPKSILAKLPGQESKAGTDTALNAELSPAVVAAVNDPARTSVTAPMAAGAGSRDSKGSTRASGSSGSTEPQFAHSTHPGVQGNAPVVAQQGALMVDSSSTSRDLIPRTGASIPASTISGGVASTAPGADGREAFAALDGAIATPAWAQAGSHRAEAGFQDSTLGWIGVRADGVGAQVHAAVLPGSAEAAQALGGHLSGLNGYLEEQHLHVASVTVASPENRSVESGGGQSGNQGMQQEAGQNAGQGSGESARPGTFGSESAGTERPQEIASALSAVGTTILPASEGGHISVMA